MLPQAILKMQNYSLNEPPNIDDGTVQNGTDSAAGDDADLVVPPQHLFSDYVEIAYLGLVICAGLALNVSVLKRLLLERRRARRGNKVMSGFLLLKLNLNVSDILILLIHASGKLGWLITYDWRGGETLCRLFNLLSMFTLYLSSNIVICIALDRLCTVLTARRMDLAQQKLNMVRLMITLAWSFSLMFSLPQLFVWTTYNPFKGTTMSRGWVQCTDIWSIDRYERFLAEQLDKNLSTASTEEGGRNQTSSNASVWSEFILQPLVQNTYEISHLFLVFYGPLIALVFCYVLISSRLIRFAANNPCAAAAHTIKQPPQSSDNLPPVAAVTCNSAERRQLFKRAAARSVPAMRMLYPSSGKWRRKLQHYNFNNQQHNHLAHHAPLMDIVELSSTSRAEERSNGGTAPVDSTTLLDATCRQKESKEDEGGTMAEDGNEKCPPKYHNQSQSSSLLTKKDSSLDNSAMSLPVFGRSNSSCASAPPVRRPSVSTCSVQLNDGTAAAVPLSISHCAIASTPSYSHHSVSCCSSTMSSSHDLKLLPTTERYEKHQQQQQHRLQIRQQRARKAQILFRIRDSFRESFGKKKLHRRSRLDDAELTSPHCLSNSSSMLDNGMRKSNQGRRDTLPECMLSSTDLHNGGADDQFCCPSLARWMGRMKRSQIWKLGQNGGHNEKQRICARNSTTSSSGAARQFYCATTTTTAFNQADVSDDTSVSPSPYPRPASASNPPNGDASSAVQSVHKSSWFSRNHSVRSSYSTTISTVLNPNGRLTIDTNRPRPVASSGHFLWRHRSRAFRTTLLVILVHILLWSPYNVYALMKHVNERLYERMNEQANVLKDLQFLITLINPFLYGFGRSSSGGGGRGRAAVGQQQETRPKGRSGGAE